MPQDVGILTTVLKIFLDQFIAGYGRIHGSAVTLLHLVGLIDLILAAIFAVWSKEGELTWLAQKALAYGFWVLLIAQWLTLMPIVIDGFIWVGLRAGGSTVTVKEFTNPSKIAELGIIATEPIWNHIRHYGWTASLHLVDITISGLCGLAILAGFFIIAIELFVFFLQFYIFAVLASILIPFGINRYTSWLTDTTFTTLVAHGIKVMVLGFLTSVMFPILQQITAPHDPTWKQLFGMLLGVWAITILCLVAPRYAVGTIAQGPQLTAGVFAGTTIAGGLVLTTARHLLGGRSRGNQTRLPPKRHGGTGPQSSGVKPQTP
jgi:type IV secretion system protein TrbL